MKSDQHHHLAPQTEEDTSELSDWFKRNWPRIALGVVLVLLIAVLVYQRIDASHQRAAAARGNVAMARYNIQQLEAMNPPPTADQEQAATLRQQFADTARDALAAARQNSSEPSVLAEADVAEGDLNWTLANLPALAGAATRPSLNLPKSESEYLNQAAEAYEQVLRKYPDESIAAVSARFGLAAIAENKHDWDAAGKQYQAIADMKNIPQTFRDQAARRQNDLKTLQEPIYLAPATAPTTAPAPATQAATQPVAAPTTHP